MAAQGKSFIVGAAIGNGMAAQAASRGGADFLLALNAGRFRAMGIPSIASILPLKDNNRFVLDFSEEEILGKVSLPVYFGAAAHNPRTQLGELVEAARRAGFSGVANFPTVAWIDGRVRAALEEAGLGLKRELQLLLAARERRLGTIAYVRSLAEARAFAEIGADIINLNFGWNAGGQSGRAPRQELEEVAGYARHVFRSVRRIHPRAVCSIEGGPIIGPDHLVEVCRLAEADAYIGGSTIDRLPTEVSIAETTARFKAIHRLQWHLHTIQERLARFGLVHGLLGHSPPMRELHEKIRDLAGQADPVLIMGEAGSGKRTAALALHHAAKGKNAPIEIDLRGRSPEEQMRLLFGSEGDEGGQRQFGWLEWAGSATVIVRGLLSATPDCQRRLAAMIAGTGAAEGAGETPRMRVILLHTVRNAGDPREQLRRLPPILRRQIVHIAPLRLRVEDIPVIADLFLADLRERQGGTAKGLTSEAYRLLMHHEWPENVRELRDILTAAVRQETGELIGDGVLRPLLRPEAGHPVSKRMFGSERDWILHGLSVNGFRRFQTAQYLGMSRKTLYNKIRQYGIK